MTTESMRRKEAELYQVLFRNLTTRHGRRNKTPRSALTASTSLMTFLKRSLGGQKVFVFSSIPPGNALHITVGRFIFKNIKSRPQGTCEIFYSPFRVHDPARARLWNSKTTPEQTANSSTAVTALLRRRHLVYIVYTKFYFTRIGRREPRMEGFFFSGSRRVQLSCHMRMQRSGG